MGERERERRRARKRANPIRMWRVRAYADKRVRQDDASYSRITRRSPPAKYSRQITSHDSTDINTCPCLPPSRSIIPTRLPYDVDSHAHLADTGMRLGRNNRRRRFGHLFRHKCARIYKTLSREFHVSLFPIPATTAPFLLRGPWLALIRNLFQTVFVNIYFLLAYSSL